jgi:DNA repair exonuclease SbcCD ATPase subunit
MTRFDPHLSVKRLVIRRGAASAFDEQFHPGVNVLRGDNSAGKSTILNLLFYALGGDLTEWSEEALLCDHAIVEVELSGKIATLSRQISATPKRPMDIFGGSIKSALAAPISEWAHYPYARTSNYESFSQAIFRLLKMPEVTSATGENITIHQILRILYADQLTAVDELFMFERFDNATRRDTIGRLLCGAHDNSLYSNELELRALDKEFSEASAELRSLFSLLGRTEQTFTRDFLSTARSNLTEELARIRSEIEATEAEIYSAERPHRITLKIQKDLFRKVQGLQRNVSAASSAIESLLFAIADSDKFIQSLVLKLEALEDSGNVAAHIGPVKFKFCPVCYSPISEVAGDQQCGLCKTPFDSDSAKERITALINDTSLQLRQSRLLQEDRKKKLVFLEDQAKRVQAEWRKASQQLTEAEKLPSSAIRARLRELQQRAGYIRRQLEDINEKERIAEMIQRMSDRKADLNAKITKLKTDNESIRASQEKQLSLAFTAIADEVIKLLRNDLPREDSFEAAESVNFSFLDNKVSVGGKNYFSASSRAYLKSSFFAGFLAAAAKNPSFRHPRFSIIDIVEDKGMEQERSQNFQRELVRISEACPSEHQLIFATSMVAPELSNEKYAIGGYFSRDNRPLKL